MHAILVVVALAASSSALAQPCLDLSVSHTDQRDLNAVRAAVEEDCPCASAASKRSYRRCSKGILRDAFDGGMVRGECRRNAKRLVRKVTCGTSKVACAFVRNGAPRGCRPRSVQRCRSRGSLTANPCPQTHHADVGAWTAGTCVDVRENGTYAPAATNILFTKDSIAEPGTLRELDTVIWYPAAPGAGPIDASVRAVRDAPLDPSGGPYPIIMFSHGSCGVPTQSLFMQPLLASHGFIVVAPPHPGNRFTDGATCAAPATLVASALERPQDIIHVLDEMVAANLDAGSPFFGAVDETRVGMMGHSFGGFTTYLVADLDPRIDAAVPLAPAANGVPGLGVPSLTMVGSVDGVVNNAPTRDRFDESASPKYWVDVAHGGHYVFSDLCFPGPDCNPPTTLEQDESHAAALRWILPFLEVYVAGDQTFAPFLAEPHPAGVTAEFVP